MERGLDALLSEAQRVARYGFTATELERQKQSTLRFYEQYALEKDNTESRSRADEYVRNFVGDESLPSADDEYALHKKFLPGITLEEINKVAREWFPDRNRVLIVEAPEKPGLVIPANRALCVANFDTTNISVEVYAYGYYVAASAAPAGAAAIPRAVAIPGQK